MNNFTRRRTMILGYISFNFLICLNIYFSFGSLVTNYNIFMKLSERTMWFIPNRYKKNWLAYPFTYVEGIIHVFDFFLKLDTSFHVFVTLWTYILISNMYLIIIICTVEYLYFIVEQPKRRYVASSKPSKSSVVD